VPYFLSLTTPPDDDSTITTPLFITTNLRGRVVVRESVFSTEEYVGCEEIDDGVWNLWFGPLLLGRFDERELKIYGVRGLQ